MTLKEAAQALGKSESTLKTSFPRTQKNLAKEGIILTKNGRGDTASYKIEYTENYKPSVAPGMRFGRLIVQEEVDSIVVGGKKRGAWKCLCDCGNETIVLRERLINGNTQSCGCLQQEHYQNKKADLTNQHFGRLTALYPTEKRDNDGGVIWHCKCDCGNEYEVSTHSLKRGNTTSCGCLNSKGEQKIMQLLQENNVLFQKEKSFSNCYSKEYGILRFDFWVNNQYLIEYDGIQHFISDTKKGGWNTPEKVLKTQKNDKYKNQWCKENNIPLIRIPYTHLNDLCIEDLLLETSHFII